MGGDLFEILFVLAFILFGVLGGRKKRPTETPVRRAPRDPRAPRPTQGARPQRTPPTAQDALLRELEGLLTGRRPAAEPAWLPSPGPEVPDPAEARSLETLEVEETASWEEGLERAAEVHDTERWIEGRDRGAATLETLEGAGEKSHVRFHDRYDVHAPAPRTGGDAGTFDLRRVRHAVIWAEILGPPVSLR